MTWISLPILITLKICPIGYSGEGHMVTVATLKIETKMIILLQWSSGAFKIKLLTGGILTCFLCNPLTLNVPDWAKKYFKRIKLSYFTVTYRTIMQKWRSKKSWSATAVAIIVVSAIIAAFDQREWRMRFILIRYFSRYDGHFVLIYNHEIQQYLVIQLTKQFKTDNGGKRCSYCIKPGPLHSKRLNKNAQTYFVSYIHHQLRGPYIDLP